MTSRRLTTRRLSNSSPTTPTPWSPTMAASPRSTRETRRRRSPTLERALLLDPLSPDVRFYLGRTLVDLNRADEASALVSRGLRAAPESIQLLDLQTALEFRKGNLFNYIGGLQKLIQADPAFSELLANTASLLLAIGETEGARRWVQRLEDASPSHPETFGILRVMAIVERDVEGLEQVLSRWQTLNSDRRLERTSEGVGVDFGTSTRASLLTLQADLAHLDGRLDDESDLRKSAVEVATPVLMGSDGSLKLSIETIPVALTQTENLLQLSEARQADLLLEAILDYNDSYDELVSFRFAALTLADGKQAALEFVETKVANVHFLPMLDRIRDNPFGLYDDLAADPRFLAFHDAVEDRYRALRERLRAELPQMLDATVGL